VEKLECLLLAIDHAGGYIFTEMIALKAYLPLLESNTKRVLNRPFPAFGLEHNQDPVFTTLDTSFKAIERADPMAITILTYCSFYTNVDIPIKTFENMTEMEGKIL